MAQSIIDALFHYMLVFDKHSIGLPIARLKNCLLNVEQNDIGNLFSYLEKLLQSADRINVNI